MDSRATAANSDKKPGWSLCKLQVYKVSWKKRAESREKKTKKEEDNMKRRRKERHQNLAEKFSRSKGSKVHSTKSMELLARKGTSVTPFNSITQAVSKLPISAKLCQAP